MTEAVLTINQGSSSVKFSLYQANANRELGETFKGLLEGIGTNPQLTVKNNSGETFFTHSWEDATQEDHSSLFAFLLEWIKDNIGDTRVVAVGHRVVFGGQRYTSPTIVDAEVYHHLEELIPMVPLHQPVNLAPIKILMSLLPDLPQVACFDTAFHQSIPRLAKLYGLPRSMADEGILAYGFHGLSYEYIAGELKTRCPEAYNGRTIVAHLGSGASMAALVNGQSIACSLGFSALDGLLMGTRPGALDPGIILYLMQAKGMDVKALEKLFYKECGLLGVSGISNDMRDLVASDSPAAKEAIDLYVYRAARALASMAGATEGIDALVFTAGTGENDSSARAAICKRAAWLGIELDETANKNNELLISTPDSPVAVWVIPTNEERMIARHTYNLVTGKNVI